MAVRDVRRPTTSLLRGIDAVALVAFVLVGMGSHDETVSAAEAFLRNAVPLLAAWFGVGALLRCYREPLLRSLLRTWAVAIPLAVAVRSVWVGSPTGTRFVTFLAVTLAFTLVLLLAGRGLASVLGRR